MSNLQEEVSPKETTIGIVEVTTTAATIAAAETVAEFALLVGAASLSFRSSSLLELLL